jgi:YHS domain-containing protein
MRLRPLAAALLLALAAAPLPALAAATWQGVAEGEPVLSGYDPVAYFIAGMPMPGDPKLTQQWQGATFRFTSAETLKAFVADPARYAPQFGGWCAWAASQGRLAKPDPTIWHIVNGKLYLNCSKQAEEKWLTDVPGNIAKAEAFWAAQAAK